MSQLSLNLGTITEGGRNETETRETSSKIVSSGHDRNMAPTNPHQLQLTAHASQQARMQWEGAHEPSPLTVSHGQLMAS